MRITAEISAALLGLASLIPPPPPPVGSRKTGRKVFSIKHLRHHKSSGGGCLASPKLLNFGIVNSGFPALAGLSPNGNAVRHFEADIQARSASE